MDAFGKFFSEGVKFLTQLESKPRLEQVRIAKSRDIDLDVGGELLHGYQKTWKAIQTDTKESSAKASEVTKLLTPLFKVWDQHMEAVTKVEEEAKAIPELLATLGTLQTLLDDLRMDFAAIEKGLDLLENLCEEQEHQKRCQEELKKVGVYRMQKEEEAEKIKVGFAKAHARKMAEAEVNKRHNLQERAEAFTSAFRQDIEYYRTHGRPDRLPVEFPKVSSLSEIEIAQEQDKTALNTFLEGEAEPGKDPIESPGEEAYIEDDYITGFSVKQDVDFLDDIEYISSTVISSSDLAGDDEDTAEEEKNQELEENSTHDASDFAQAIQEETMCTENESKEKENQEAEERLKEEKGVDSIGDSENSSEKESNQEEQSSKKESENKDVSDTKDIPQSESSES